MIQLLMYYCLSIVGYDFFVTIEFVACMDLLLEDEMQWLLGQLFTVGPFSIYRLTTG